jgi:hypothetical protein
LFLKIFSKVSGVKKRLYGFIVVYDMENKCIGLHFPKSEIQGCKIQFFIYGGAIRKNKIFNSEKLK